MYLQFLSREKKILYHSLYQINVNYTKFNLDGIFFLSVMATTIFVITLIAATKLESENKIDIKNE